MGALRISTRSFLSTTHLPTVERVLGVLSGFPCRRTKTPLARNGAFSIPGELIFHSRWSTDSSLHWAYAGQRSLARLVQPHRRSQPTPRSRHSVSRSSEIGMSAQI